MQKFIITLCMIFGATCAAERPLPALKQPVLFNTPEADAILSLLQALPADSPWLQDISKVPVLPNSTKMIAGIGAEKHLGFNKDMCFIIVPENQPLVPVKLVEYPQESDPGPYPVPENAPIEQWPLNGETLDKIQREGTGDRHLLILDPYRKKLFEFYQARKTATGWEASCEATFELSSNKLRPAGWTSSDAAGLPIFPAIVRFDECERGKVEHALRFTVRRTRREYLPPATHFASKITDPDVPAMGQRFRLKADVDCSKLSKHAQAVCYALKKYGMFVADNGSDWLISTAPDARLKGLEGLRMLKGSDFEVVK